MQATTGAPKASPQSVFDNPFTQAFQAMFTPKPDAAKPAAAANPFAANPFLQAFEAMSKPAAAAKPVETPAPEGTELTNLFNQMFDSGIEVQKSYQKSMDSIFDTYFASLKPGSKEK
jgi:hypothetical protein